MAIDRPITHALSKFPEHAAIIGDLLVGYGQIEFLMIAAVKNATGLSNDDAVRVLYRVRSAQTRLDVVDALVRPFYLKHGLKGPYCNWLGAMRKCKAIRNQYAHSDWDARDTGLWFASLEETATPPEGTAFISFNKIELALLKKQRAYFRYAEDLLWYLIREGEFRLDGRRRHNAQIPKSQPAPSLYSPPS